MVNINGIFVRQLIDALTQEGERALWDAYNNRDFVNRTYNLHDSYGSAVYANGKVIKSTIRYLSAEMAKSGTWRSMGWEYKGKGRSMPDFRGDRYHRGDEMLMSGRDEIMDFFAQYTPKTNGIELVIAAAMYYAGYLENGTKTMFRKYRVISGATTTMEDIARRYNGKLQSIQLGRVLYVPHTLKNNTWSKK